MRNKKVIKVKMGLKYTDVKFNKKYIKSEKDAIEKIIAYFEMALNKGEF